MQLTLAMIVRDEADRISRAIRSCPAATEILVLDSGSTDGTPCVARALGARVIETDWPGFAAQRNRALAAARGELVLFLDADEWLSVDAQAEIARIRRTPQAIDAWSFPRRNRWLGHPLQYGRWGRDRVVRLGRGGTWIESEGVERWVHDRTPRALSAPIEHAPYRSVAEHLETIDRYSRMQAQGGGGVRALGHASWHLFHALIVNQGLRDGLPGLSVAALGALHSGLKWHR